MNIVAHPTAYTNICACDNSDIDDNGSAESKILEDN